MPEARLTEKNKRFAEEYIKCYNATKAYNIAYQNDNMATCNAQGYRVLKNPAVKQYIAILQKEAVERYGDLAEVIAKELAENIVSRDLDGKHLPDWQKSVDLLQKQLSLQNQKISADINNDVQIEVKINED